MTDAFSRNWSGANLELQMLTKRRPTLAAACATFSALLGPIFDSVPAETPLVISPEDARAKLCVGVPLLRGQALCIDDPALKRRWMAICDALHQDHADALAAAVRQGTLRPSALLDAVITEGPETAANAMATVEVDPALGATVLRMAALPALSQITRNFVALRQGKTWDFGYCPNCGSWPLLGEARGIEQERFLRCGLCAAAWPCGRLFCPFCGNRDYRTLGYIHVEGEEDRYRAGTCEECHGYVKWVSTIFTLTEPQLLIADLSTIHLDLAAAERGFYAP